MTKATPIKSKMSRRKKAILWSLLTPPAVIATGVIIGLLPADTYPGADSFWLWQFLPNGEYFSPSQSASILTIYVGMLLIIPGTVIALTSATTKKKDTHAKN